MTEEYAAIDYRENASLGSDSANRSMLGIPVSRTVKLMMFTIIDNATWAADRLNRRQGYPRARLSLKCNRDAFSHDVGDLFAFTFQKYGISRMICRITAVQEEDVESEEILITAEEEVEYISNVPVLASGSPVTRQTGLSTSPPNWSLTSPTGSGELNHVGIFEAPHSLVGDKLVLIPVAAREVGTELGYHLYISVDGGSSYSKIDTVSVFNAYGTLVSVWPTSDQPYGRGTYQLGSSEDISPSELGLMVDFTSDFDVSQISSVVRTQVFGGAHMSILGEELISFQNIAVVSGYSLRYSLTGIYSGRFDSEHATHSVGEDFWFVGNGHRHQIEHPDIMPGAVLYFKFVPFNAQSTGDISEAIAVEKTIEGRAKKPYFPINFNGCGRSYHAEYPCSTTSSTTSTTSTTV